MAYRTFGELSTQVENELDLQTEDFVDKNVEMKDYFNSAMREVEAELSKIGLREKYLQKDTTIDVVVNQSDYTLPTDIIDADIRKMVYHDGNIVYTMHPDEGEDSYERDVVENIFSVTDYYKWKIRKVGEDYKLRIIPKASKSVTGGIVIHYWASLNRYTADGTNCDVPEICYEFIRASVKLDCVRKEFGRPDISDFNYEKERTRKLMQDTLSGQIKDPDIDKVDQDLSVYQEHS